MEGRDELLQWAKEKKVFLKGIRPARIPGRGIGIVAHRKLKVGFLSPWL
jgi:hypothetical protein